MSKLLVVSLVSSTLLSGAAFAEPESMVGSITSMSGDLGTAVVQRGTDTFSIDAGDKVYVGDKIVTLVDGMVDVSAYGCTISVPAEATITVDPEFCSDAPVTVASMTALTEGPAMASAESSGTGALIGRGSIWGAAISASSARSSIFGRAGRAGRGGDRSVSP